MHVELEKLFAMNASTNFKLNKQSLKFDDLDKLYIERLKVLEDFRQSINDNEATIEKNLYHLDELE